MVNHNNVHPVKLVGAGPGDPELLTIKAVKAIAWASVILIDDLVNPQVLDHANESARVIHVGKRGSCKSTPQEFIERLMVSQAKSGERVVRLKGGDPLVFGRAGEEIGALRAAGLRLEVIPGITSALAAAASLQVSLTHRDFGPGLVLLTAHRRADAQTKSGFHPTDWPTLLNCGLTLGLYMASGQVEVLQTEALAAGLPLTLPVAVVQNASRPDEKRVVSTLAQFVHDIRAQSIGSPAILLIGQALSLIVIEPIQFQTLQQVRA